MISSIQFRNDIEHKGMRRWIEKRIADIDALKFEKPEIDVLVRKTFEAKSKNKYQCVISFRSKDYPEITLSQIDEKIGRAIVVAFDRLSACLLWKKSQRNIKPRQGALHEFNPLVHVTHHGAAQTYAG